MKRDLPVTQSQFPGLQVAKAVGMEWTTLHMWRVRGFLPDLDTEGPRGFRRFSQLDVAFVAALRALSLHMQISDASDIMRKVVERQRKAWRDAVAAASEDGPSDMWVIVLRRADDDGDLSQVHFYPGENLRDAVRMYGSDTRGGWTNGGDAPAADVVSCVATFDIGPAVAAALAKLDAGVEG